VHGVKYITSSTIELKNIRTASDNNGFQQDTLQLRSVPILSDVVGTLFTSVIVLTPKDNFWIVPLLHSVSDTKLVDSHC
jgi:hypothetical protein